MSYRKLTRPSSGRRSIRQETFSPFVSCSRLRLVQSILTDGEDGPDAVLGISGIDSRYHEGSGEFINYLLFDLFQSRKSEIEKSGYDEEVIDDLMLLVKKGSVHVYCNPVNYLFLLPYIGSWPNLRIHCLNEDDYADEESAEEFKIKSFIAMVGDCKRVGVSFSSTCHSYPFDKMAIEKWPIIQAYALDEYGELGFFTLQHETIDVSEQLKRIYSIVDPVTVEGLVTEHLPLFERQFNTMMNTMDNEGATGMVNMTEKRACEPLKSYFSHGRVGQDKKVSRYPFVLFGTDTRRRPLKAAASTGLISEVNTPQETGIRGKLASHMICQSVSPRGPLSCTRTYFLQSGHNPYPVTEKMRQPQDHHKDTKLLTILYTMAVDALLSGLDVYAASFSQTQAERHVLNHLQTAAEAHKLQLGKNFITNSNNVEFRIEAFDNLGSPIPLKDGERVPMVKSATISIYDVPSTEHSGQTLGSIMFAESFLESNIQVLNKDGSLSCDASLTVLTHHVPHHATWMMEKSDVEMKADINSFLSEPTGETFGHLLMNGDTADLVRADSTATKQEGSLYAFDGGLIFNLVHGDTVVIPHNEIKDVQFYDGDSPSNVILMIVNYEVTLRAYLPDWLLLPTNRLVITMSPKSKASKAFYSEVLPLWRKEDQKISLKHLEKLDTDVESLYAFLQLHHSMSSHHPLSTSPLKKVSGLLPDFMEFLGHFLVSSVGRVPVDASDLPVLLQQPAEIHEDKDADEIVVTIVSGIPGSYKESLCNVLTNMIKDESRWLVFRQPIENTDAFNAESLQNSLAVALQAQKRKRPGVGRKQLRTLVCTPGFTNVLEVVQAIMCHPNHEVAEHLKIGAVTVCVDPLNVYMTDRFTFPKLLDQCSQGFVNNVMFTSSTDAKNRDLASIQELIRATNSDVAFLLANKGESLRSQDVDLVLSESAFTSSNMSRSRHLLCPGWSSLLTTSQPDTPRMEMVCLQFALPLERSRLVSRLKGLKSSLCKFPFIGNVYFIKGKVRFTGNPKMFEIDYCTNTGIFRSTPTDMQPTPPSAPGSNGPSRLNGHQHCVVFTGCGLDENKMRDWLRSCGKQKPTSKERRTKQNLTNEEKMKIHAEHHLDTLPEGWFYNGTQFVSLEGDRSDLHPNLDAFISEFLAVKNRAIDSYNQRIEAEEYPDMFA
ncbi:dynein axonemal assembly factor 9-like [Lineus longissimus]|uniref:dynein axonemal assembly factor 9-like n=1 Tax=Lineus longissimus TaxID=88925 RepID=UPI002B4D5C86